MLPRYYVVEDAHGGREENRFLFCVVLVKTAVLCACGDLKAT
jgi:hypothetical protein